MTSIAANALRIEALIRLERAAGEAFGCEAEASSVVRAAVVTPATIALATFATALAATITYLV